MKCPVCNRIISEAAAVCPGCGAHFGDEIQKKLAYYFSLRHEWEQLMGTCTTLNQQLKELAVIVMGLEESIGSELARHAASVEVRPRERVPEAPQTAPVQAPATGVPQGQRPAEAPVRPAQPQQPQQPQQFRAPQQPSGARKEDFTDRIKKQVLDPEFKIGQKALLFVGIITMVFGVAFFLKYSFDQGWIGPAGRVALAYLWGLSFLIVGHVIRQKQFPAFGLALFGGGIAVLYFATYASFQMYHLLPQTAAFAVMVLVTVLACATAVAYETQALAILGLIGGFMTPILLSTGQNNYGVLFSYMALLNAGILAISMRKRWVILQYIGFAVTWIVFTGWYMQHHYRGDLTQFWTALAFVNIFYFFYSIIPFSYHFINREKHDLNGLYILIPNSVIAFAYSYCMIEGRYATEWVSLVTLAYALLFMLFASMVYRQGEAQREAFVVMLLKSTFFLILTVPLLFSKHWITLFWALQAAALLVGARKLSRNSFFITGAGLLVIALAKYVIYDTLTSFGYHQHASEVYIHPSFGYRIVERWLTQAVLAATLYQFLRYTGRATLKFLKDGGRSYAPLFAILFGGFLFLILTGETSSYFHDYLQPARLAAISVVWAFFSMALMVLGFKKDNDKVRKVALGLLFATLLKVFTFDISNISTPYRIVSLIVLGLIMILISYLYNKAKEHLLETQRSGEEAEE